MNNHCSYESFGRMGGRGGMRPMGGRGGMRPMGGRMGGPMGGRRPFGMNHPHRFYHHPKPRYHYNYYNNFYPYNSYYYYPVVSYTDQDFCFCTDPKDEYPNQEKVCVGNTCGVCIPRSFCTTCHEKITCKKQE